SRRKAARRKNARPRQRSADLRALAWPGADCCRGILLLGAVGAYRAGTTPCSGKSHWPPPLPEPLPPVPVELPPAAPPVPPEPAPPRPVPPSPVLAPLPVFEPPVLVRPVLGPASVSVLSPLPLRGVDVTDPGAPGSAWRGVV